MSSPRPSAAYRNPRKHRFISGLPARRRLLLHVLLALVSSLLVTNALIGDRGLIEAVNANRKAASLQLEIDQLRLQNENLRRQAHRLREEPAAIEEAARRGLGLVRPGELLFLLTELVSARQDSTTDRIDLSRNPVLASEARITSRGGAVR